MEDREVAGGTLRWLSQEQIQDWRRQSIERLHNTDGRRIVRTVSDATDKSLEPAELSEAGNPVIERPEKTKPRTGRETADIMTKVIVKQWMIIRKNDPKAWRRKLDELRALSPASYAHMSDDELEAAVVEVCRRVIVEPMVAEAAERSPLYKATFYQGPTA